MSETNLKAESQRYLDEMMKYYSMNQNASVSTKEPESTVVSLKTVPPEIDALENETGQIQEDIADEEVNMPKSNMQSDLQNKSGEFEINNSEPDDISDEKINEPPVQELEKPAESNSEINKDEEAQISFESRFPLPVIPDFIRNSAPAPDMSETTTPDYSQSNLPPMNNYSRIPEQKPASDVKPPYSDYGFLKVEVRTGENGLPVENAAVTVTSKNGNNNDIVFTGSTDNSGSVKRIRLPAPHNSKGSTAESFQNYAVYTVSIFAKDFYREISQDVPIFAGITSIQRFNLIPMPFKYDDNGQSIVYKNTEPNI